MHQPGIVHGPFHRLQRYGRVASQSLHRSSRYRFHDSVRKDRKFLIVALASALVLAAILSRLVLDFPHAFPK